MSKSETPAQKVVVKHYFYPNLYYVIGVFALVTFIGVFFWPVKSSYVSVSAVAIVSLLALAISLIAGPLSNSKTIENAWLKDAAASSFVITFGMLAIGSSLAFMEIIDWQLANIAAIAIASLDFLAKLIIAKRRDS